MRLHTKLSYAYVYAALKRAKDAGRVTPDVQFLDLEPHKSRTHPFGWEIQLGTYDKYSLPAGTVDQRGKAMRVRRYKNSGTRGAAGSDGWVTPSAYAATWHEWGWFMAAVFEADPDARWGSLKGWGYRSLGDFTVKTKGAFDKPLFLPEDLLDDGFGTSGVKTTTIGKEEG